MEPVQDTFTSLPLWQWKVLLAVPLIPLAGYVVQIFSHCVFKVTLPRKEVVQLQLGTPPPPPVPPTKSPQPAVPQAAPGSPRPPSPAPRAHA